jgi:V8-like Glu-specific endopeptidase
LYLKTEANSMSAFRLLGWYLGLLMLSGFGLACQFATASGQQAATGHPLVDVNRDLPEVDEDRLQRERQPMETKPIYNEDDRMDLGKIWDPNVKKNAAATVALFNPSLLTLTGDGAYKINAETLKDRYGLCDGQRFQGQIAGAYCSGVLVSPDVILTAGHCVNEIRKGTVPNAEQINFVFGYAATDDKDPGVTSFAAARVFKGKELIGGQLIRKSDGGEDWATVRLERTVPQELAQPVESISKEKIADGASVYVVGHPSGLPLKYADGAKVTANNAKAYFVANLDTFGGNSGSGVFLKNSNSLVGILVRGFADYYRTSDGCAKVYQCSSNGCTGEDVTRAEPLPLR